MITLEQIIAQERAYAKKNGEYGLDACKESVLSTIKTNKLLNERSGKQTYTTSLYELLESYVNRANTDVFFNRTMVLACWELINKQ
mgnify:CR=1 FL=1